MEDGNKYAVSYVVILLERQALSPPTALLIFLSI